MRSTSTLEYALIGLLKQKPQSGYDLRKFFATTPMRHFSDSPGSIYPALDRLQKRKWLAASSEKDNARKRRVFRVLPGGEQAFIDWLRVPVTRDEIIWRMDEILLRFAFFDGNVRRSESARFLGSLERELTAYIRELRAYAATFTGAVASSTGALAFASGIHSYQSHVAWARRARKKLMETLI